MPHFETNFGARASAPTLCHHDINSIRRMLPDLSLQTLNQPQFDQIAKWLAGIVVTVPHMVAEQNALKREIGELERDLDYNAASAAVVSRRLACAMDDYPAQGAIALIPAIASSKTILDNLAATAIKPKPKPGCEDLLKLLTEMGALANPEEVTSHG